MNESVNGFLLTIIGLIIAVLIATFGFGIYQSLKTSGNASMLKVEKMNTQMDESEFTQYDGEMVTGTQVLTLLNTFKDRGVVVHVHNGKQGFDFYINPEEDSSSQASTQENWAKSMKAVKTRSSKYYITPSAQFQGSIGRDDKGAIIEISFTKVGATADALLTELPTATKLDAAT